MGPTEPGTSEVPPREEWPDPPPATEAAGVLTDVILTTFRLNARLMEAGQNIAARGGITVAWWQVLGGILDEPRSIPEIGRRMGMTRQGVRRVADLLVERGLAEYRPSPVHGRAQLLTTTEAGYWAIRQISLVQHPWADELAGQLDLGDLTTTLETMRQIIEVLERQAD
jgi:DNA-binding MarR family transcriptional regulator